MIFLKDILDVMKMKETLPNLDVEIIEIVRDMNFPNISPKDNSRIQKMFQKYSNIWDGCLDPIRFMPIYGKKWSI